MSQFRTITPRDPTHVVIGTVPPEVKAGDRFSVAHGFTDYVGRPLTPRFVLAQVLAPDADTSAGSPVVPFAPPLLTVVGWDRTQVTLRSTAKEQQPDDENYQPTSFLLVMG